MEEQKPPDPDQEANDKLELLSLDQRTERFLKRLDIQHRVLKKILGPTSDVSDRDNEKKSSPEK